MAKLYAALRAANVPDSVASEAAEEMAENRFKKMLIKFYVACLIFGLALGFILLALGIAFIGLLLS